MSCLAANQSSFPTSVINQQFKQWGLTIHSWLARVYSNLTRLLSLRQISQVKPSTRYWDQMLCLAPVYRGKATLLARAHQVLMPMWLKIQLKRGRMTDRPLGNHQEFKSNKTSRPQDKKILIQRERTKARLPHSTRTLGARNRLKISSNLRRPSNRLKTGVILKTRVTPRTLILPFGPHLITRNQTASNYLTQISTQRTLTPSKAFRTSQNLWERAERGQTTRLTLGSSS